MEKTAEELHTESMLQFVKLANEQAAAGISPRVIAAGLMTASCVYSTFVEVGNTGNLNNASVDLISAGYKNQLQRVQQDRHEKYQRENAAKMKQTVETIVSFPEDD